MSKAIELNTASFQEEVLNSQTPVLVDFYASWCGPCQMMAPVLDELAGDLAGKVKVSKINTEDNIDLAQKYEIASIPNMKLFKNGKVVKEFIGLKSKAEIASQVA